MRHGLATLNSYNSIVYGQKHKVCVLVFLVRTSGTFWDQIWVDVVVFSVLQQNCIIYSNSIQRTLLSISSNVLCVYNVPPTTKDVTDHILKVSFHIFF